MTGGAPRHVKLRGGPDKTASSVMVRENGSLVVEFYDFSPEAESWFGNDVAYTLTVNAFSKLRVQSELLAERGMPAESGENDDLLLRMIEERFSSYFELQEWLGTHGIPYEKKFEAWA